MLAFGLKVLDWNTAQLMSFTAVELCAKDALEWSGGVKEAKEKQARRRGI